jgi:hypothetical protein
VDHVPVAELVAQRLAQRLRRVLVRLGGGLEGLGDQRVVVGCGLGERVADQRVLATGLDLGRDVGDLAGGVLVGGVGRPLGGPGLAGARLEVGAAAHVRTRVVEVGALDGAVGLEGLAGVSHRVSSFSGVVQSQGAVQPKTASTPWAKRMSKPATSATMTATKTITTVV